MDSALPRALGSGLALLIASSCSDASTPGHDSPATTAGAGATSTGGALERGGAGGRAASSSGGAATAGGTLSKGGSSEAGGVGIGESGGSLGRAGESGAGGAVVAGAGNAGTGGAGGSGGSAAGGAAVGGANRGGASGSGEGGAGGGGRCEVAKQNASALPQALSLSGNLGTHDPALIFAHGQYYLFHTGDGIGAKTSSNLREWKAAPAVFASNPSWIAEAVPGATNLWAPDISFFGGSYHLYYSASTFGKNRSCIGHATRAALDAGSFTDHGSVVCSNPSGGSSDDWNAIDPNVIVDQAGVPWLSFGSFWGGLKLVELDASGARANDTIISIAARPRDDGALEAPFIVWRCGYYYLFVSFDTCCQGVDSTYKVMVGRATSVAGPYSDREGRTMMEGGGTLVLAGNTRWRGPGHNAVVFDGSGAYNVYHSYDANNNGAAMLRISELVWDGDGWPISGGP
jgi:arabinan endo-1,5-alpha-L-arabinosidase